MTATMFSKKITNAFQEHNENTIQPFYQDSGAMFYKNKLINVEDIVEHYEMNTDDNSEFEAYSSKISYLLTFEDDKGDKHNYISSVKPKNIGAVYYYVIKEDKLENIFPEKDRKKLKPYISIDTKYEYNTKSKIYSLASFLVRHPVKIFLVLWVLFSLFLLLLVTNSYSILDHFIASALTFVPTAVIFILGSLGAGDLVQRFESKNDIFIEQKENQERECILKTFI